MSQVKDYIKVILTALLTALTTLTVSGVFTQNKKVNQSATKLELDKGLNTVKNESYIYTDNKIKEHEKQDAIRYNALNNNINETKSMVKFLYELEIKKNK